MGCYREKLAVPGGGGGGGEEDENEEETDDNYGGCKISGFEKSG